MVAVRQILKEEIPAKRHIACEGKARVLSDCRIGVGDVLEPWMVGSDTMTDQPIGNRQALQNVDFDGALGLEKSLGRLKATRAAADDRDS